MDAKNLEEKIRDLNADLSREKERVAVLSDMLDEKNRDLEMFINIKDDQSREFLEKLSAEFEINVQKSNAKIEDNDTNICCQTETVSLNK